MINLIYSYYIFEFIFNAPSRKFVSSRERCTYVNCDRFVDIFKVLGVSVT